MTRRTRSPYPSVERASGDAAAETAPGGDGPGPRLAGEHAADVAYGHRARVHGAFDALERALPQAR
ncbi:hypothetical protein ACIQK5_01315 [Streptomyces virginiae]|uniref:hypothetical protein n=1 Tax=Streptomyces virginiae TaxID=1961 RepID=UPI0037F7D470